SVLVPDFLPDYLRKKNGGNEGRPPGSDEGPSLQRFIDAQLAAGAENLYEETIKRAERILLPRVLQHTGGNQMRAARILGITRGYRRSTLRNLGITVTRTVLESDGAAE